MSAPNGFFDRFPRLRTTSTTDVRGERLEYRYRALIERNRDVIRDKRILDLGSHDGRWMLAALDAGARHVVGIEGRQQLIDRARATLQAYQITDDRYELIFGDCHTRISELRRGDFDTVFCFGFLYHTLNQYDLLRSITALEPSTLLVDSRVVSDDEPAIFLAFNDPRLEGGAIARSSEEDAVLVGVPTAAALLTMLKHLGWHAQVMPRVPSATAEWEGIRDYCEGRRVEILAVRSS